MAGKKEISLLPDEINKNTLSARFLRWLTTVGRFIVVFTELIVICAFISRFWLDRQNSDLSEAIRQQKAILNSTSEFEKEFTLLQTKLREVRSFESRQIDFPSKIKTVVQSMPPDIYFQDFVISRSELGNFPKVSVSLFTYREQPIVDFITNLSLNPDIAAINVKRIEKKSKDNRYYIDLDVNFKNNGI